MTWTSPRPPIEADDTTLPELVLEAARRAPERAALVDGTSGAAISFATLAARVERLAAALAARGFGPGDTLALWAPNLPPWAGVALAAMRAGGAVTGVNPAAGERELAAQLADADASMLVAVAPLAERARAAAAQAGVRELLVLGEAPGATAPEARPAAPGATALEALLAEDRPPVELALDGAATALLPYSSGTTGPPKGVVLTHRNLAASTRQVERSLGLGARDTVLAVALFAHVMGFVVTLAAPLSVGATVVTMPRFELDAALALVERHRVTVLVVPPPVMAALAHDPTVDRHDLSSLELIVSGGAPLGAERQRAVAERLPHAAVGQAYGLTETAVGISAPDRRAGTPPGSVGRLMPSTELRVVDPATGRELRAGRPGELWARGPQVMAGYLRRPRESAEILTEDGWLRTGDLGRVDHDGNVFILERLKELIKVGALQVPPAELEALLASHPDVADAAVIPRPDDRHGEVPVAFVVPRRALDRDALMDWVAARVAPHKRLRAVRLADRIPRTPAGKILRRELIERDMAAARPPAGAAVTAPRATPAGAPGSA